MMADVRRRNGKKSSQLSPESQNNKTDKTTAWDYIFPILVGILCAAALIIVYMAVFSSHSSPSHNDKLVSNLADARQDDALVADHTRNKIRDMKQHSPFFNQLSNKDNNIGDNIPGNKRPNNILRDFERFKKPYDGDNNGNNNPNDPNNLMGDEFRNRMNRARPGDKLMNNMRDFGVHGDNNNIPDTIRSGGGDRDTFFANNMDPRMRKRSRRERFDNKFGDRLRDDRGIPPGDNRGSGNGNNNNYLDNNGGMDNNNNNPNNNNNDDADKFGQYADDRGRFGMDDMRGGGGRMDRQRYEDMRYNGRERRERRERGRHGHGRDREVFADRERFGRDRNELMNEMRQGRRDRRERQDRDRSDRYADLRGDGRGDDRDIGGDIRDRMDFRERRNDNNYGVNGGPINRDDRMGGGAGGAAGRIREQIKNGMGGDAVNGGMVNDNDLDEYAQRKKQELRDRLNNINNDNDNNRGGGGQDAQVY